MTGLSKQSGSLLATLVLLTACAASPAPDRANAPLVRQLGQSQHCGLTAPGLTYLTRESELGKLQQLPTRTLSLAPLKAVDFEREHLLLVALGQKPTGGYGLTLKSARLDGKTLQLTMTLRQPAPDTVVTQALTTPCAVLAVTPDHWRRLTVSGVGMPELSRRR